MQKLKISSDKTRVGEVESVERGIEFIGKPEKTKRKKASKTVIEGRWRKFTLGSMLASPFIVAFISMLHIIDYFNIANYHAVAVALAIAYEILLISAFISLRQMRILDGFSQFSLWLAILVLAAIQIFGNIFSVYMKIDESMAIQFAELLDLEYGITVNRIIAVLIGSPLPLTSLIFTKIAASYWYITGVGKKNGKK